MNHILFTDHTNDSKFIAKDSLYQKKFILLNWADTSLTEGCRVKDAQEQVKVIASLCIENLSGPYVLS